MRQRNRIGCWTLVIVILMALPALQAAEPKPPTANWDNLRTVTPGAQVQVVLNNVKSYRGQFQSVSDEALVVRLETGGQTFSRHDVLRVSAKGESRRLRNALIGAGVGAGIGLGVGAAADSGCGRNCIVQSGKAIFTPLGGMIGAVAGAALPTGRWHDAYRAQ